MRIHGGMGTFVGEDDTWVPNLRQEMTQLQEGGL
jgi:hypothetical protein